MYYRSQGYRYPKDMRIPINYSGNAFSESKADNKSETLEEPSNEDIGLQAYDEYGAGSDMQDEAIETEKDAPNTSVNNSNSVTASSIFGGSNKGSLLSKIGSEELLIIALVFLLSDTDSDNDIIWLLLLLLFIK